MIIECHLFVFTEIDSDLIGVDKLPCWLTSLLCILFQLKKMADKTTRDNFLLKTI